MRARGTAWSEQRSMAHLNPVERAVLETIDELGLTPTSPHSKSNRVVDAAYRPGGIPPAYFYDTLCNLASPWLVHIPLVDLQGNYGGPDPSDKPFKPRYTQVRLSVAGSLALAADRGNIAPLPIAFINGDWFVGGTAPSFNPQRVIDALLYLADHPESPDEMLNELVGPPSFPTGCEVLGDFVALAEAREVRVECRAYVAAEEGPRPRLVLTNLPPRSSIEEIAAELAMRAGFPFAGDGRVEPVERRIALRGIRDESPPECEREPTNYRLVLELTPEADINKCIAQILETTPVTRDPHLPTTRTHGYDASAGSLRTLPTNGPRSRPSQPLCERPADAPNECNGPRPRRVGRAKNCRSALARRRERAMGPRAADPINGTVLARSMRMP